MDKASFWAIIDEARAVSERPDEIAEAIGQRLSGLSADEVRAFDGWLWEYLRALHRRDLWAAAYTIMGGCSEEGFVVFCAWLLTRGESVLHEVVREPDVLADHEWEGSPQCEWLLNVTPTVYAQLTDGEDLPIERLPLEIPEARQWPRDRLRGSEWPEDVLESRFPRLFARFW